MKTKLVSLLWRGSASVDPRFSAPMLKWSIQDIINRDIFIRLSMGIESGCLETFNSDFELQFKHQVKHIIGMCKMLRKPDGRNKYFEIGVVQTKSNGNFMELIGTINGFLYLLKDPGDPLIHIHLYETDSLDEMTELMQQMRDPSHTLGGSVGSIPQSIVSAPGSSEISVQKALHSQGVHSTPASNLKLNEALRLAHHDGGPSIFSPKMAASKSYTSGLSQSTGTVNAIPSGNLALFSEISPSHSQFFEVMYVGKIKVSHKRVPDTFIDDALPKFKAYDTQRMMRLQEEARRNSLTTDTITPSASFHHTEGTSQNFHLPSKLTDFRIKEEAAENEAEEESNDDQKDEVSTEKLVNSKIGEENKENSSPRPKDKLLQRTISQMTIPVTKNEAPIKRDRSASIGSIPIIDQNRTMVFLVGRTDLRLISPDRKQVLLYKDFKDIASCAQGHKSPDHFGIICREAQNDGFIAYVFKCQSDHVADDIVAAISQAFVTCSEQKKKEKSQILSCEQCPMLWYHKLCNDIEGLSEKKTQAMIFKRIESLSEEEQQMIMAKYYGAEEMAGHTIVQQVQFLMMLLRAHCESRQQRHIHDTAENRSEFLNQYLGGSTIFMKAKRSLSNSFDHLLKRKGGRDDGFKEITSPTTDNSLDPSRTPKILSGRSSPSKALMSEQMKSPMIDIFMKVGNSPKESGENRSASWRQAMLTRVVTPSKNLTDMENTQLISPLRSIKMTKLREKRTREELRELWRTAIRQTILLARMEKENATLRNRQNENEIKKIKLEYDEILPCDKQSADLWDQYIDKHRSVAKRDPKVLLQAIRNGVPRSKRGEVWMFLAEQHSITHAPVNVKNFPNFHTPYQALLKNLTEHQHSIFIDLGRTFPNHKFYKQSLGIGQLSLFNLLKAYSILDPELGYCQGLGFICGVLLLHLEEADAFEMLKHLMFKRQMRNKYLPDMTIFQRELYQLSRLLKDTIPELYEWLDTNEISPTLYAAPWILTLFSSQFPLGFVTRVFDLIFLESQEIIFRVAIALLEVHKDELLKRDNFEDIMDYMKNTVPLMDCDKIDQVMRRTFAMDCARQLSEYQVEYHVLQEEITTQNQHIETLNRAKETNHELEMQLQIAQSTISQLEKSKFTQQNQIHTLQVQVQSLEVTVETLGAFVNHLINLKTDLEIPGEVRRIVQQIHNAEQRKVKPLFMERKIGKSISVNSHLGMGLKILEEGNESPDVGMQGKKKSPFFENTFEQIRQQKAAMRLSSFDETATHLVKKDEMKLPEHIEKAISNMKSPIEIDSGIATPLTPQSSPASNKVKEPSTSATETVEGVAPPVHPLSNCEDVNFRFNGTTQLQTKRTGYQRTHIGAIPKALSNDDERVEKS